MVTKHNIDDEYVDTGYDPNGEYVDGLDMECDNLSMDYHEELGQFGDDVQEPEPNEQPSNGRKAKIRPMPKSYMKTFPNVASMLITRLDGRQVLFVRR